LKVSTHYQVDKESLPFQRQELENYCRYVLNSEDFVIFEDAGYSAKNTDRPAYQEMMARIHAGEFSHLLVWKIDRISRNLRDFTEMWDDLKDHEVWFISKMEQFDTSTAMGEAMLRIILVFAELERKLTAERIYGIMLDRASKGMWNGAPVALGWDWNPEGKFPILNEEEAAIVHNIFDLYEKKRSTHAVANWFATNGYKGKRGGDWSSKTIYDILRNPAYIGVYRWNYRSAARGKRKPDDEVVIVPDALPAIISRDQFERVQVILDGHARIGRGPRSREYIPLSRMIKCGYCGRLYVGFRTSVPKKNGYRPTEYRCQTRNKNGTCIAKGINGQYIEPWLLDYIRAYVAVQQKGGDLLTEFGDPSIDHIEISGSDHNVLSLVVPLGAIPEKDEAQQQIIQRTQLLEKKKKIERAMARLDDVYFFSGETQVMSKSEYTIKRQELRSSLDTVDRELASVHDNYDNGPVADVEMMSRFLILNSLYTSSSIRESHESLDRASLNEFFHLVIKYLVVEDKRVMKIVFNSPDGPVVHNIVYKEKTP
jgi:DNA invertase Pin-like site-specific DNA recombinase